MRVACLMPTIPSHSHLLPRAVDSFLKQVYPPDWCVQLVIDADPLATLGAKLNRMTAGTTAGYIVLLDDDDWHSPTRVARQVQPLIDGWDLSGTSTIYYHEAHTNEAFLYTCSSEPSWLGGMAFRRSLWKQRPFADISKGVDACWQNELRSTAKFFDLADPSLFIASIHPANTCRKNVHGGGPWKAVPTSQLGEFPKTF